MKDKAQALELVRAAFAQAQRKNGPGATTMTLAVLKNRLLQITDRRFDPNQYEVADMRGFVTMLAPDLRPLKIGRYEAVELLDTPLRGGRADRTPDRAVVAEVGTGPADTGEGARIRADLWTAITDHASGRTYVWDEQLGRARVAEPNDLQPRMPTVTPVELSEWRLTFLNAIRTDLDTKVMADVQRWQLLELPTHHLPKAVQELWSRELTLRVRYRLLRFFISISATQPEARASNEAPLAISSGEHPPEEGARTSEPDPIDQADQEILNARDVGDMFALGELLVRKAVTQTSDSDAEPLLAQAVCAWGSAKVLAVGAESFAALVDSTEAFSLPHLVTGFINTLRRFCEYGNELPDEAGDLAYKLREEIAAVYAVAKRSPMDMCRAAIAVLNGAFSDAEAALARFVRTTPVTAKAASVELIKVTHRLQPLLISPEREFVRDLEILVGPAFRKLCEAYERNDDVEVLRRAPEFLENVNAHRAGPADGRLRSRAWLSLVLPVLEHLTNLIEDATNRGEVSLAPALALRNPSTKADLRAVGRNSYLSFSLNNYGKGHARDVSMVLTNPTPGVKLALVEPPGPFDVPPRSEQLVRLRLVLDEPRDRLVVPIEWICQTPMGRQAVVSDQIDVSQQVHEPDWDALLANPPYSLNPVRRPDRLYGRESSLRKLRLAAMAGASTFVWGQKRIGKTSLLQVLAAELADRPDTTCILLRMGELTSLHEGQVAWLIAHRLVQRTKCNLRVPEEQSFGAGISRLIPFTEELVAACPGRKFVVIIDEFDDLDPAFYTGERGKQFVKGLRSVSELGLTFFFVGSERMEAIYGRHQADLNKWTNVRLDRIDSRTDCRALITAPVAGVIEYATEAIEFITDYTAGNPFYIHNFCYQVFERCLQEHRTYVDGNDIHAVRQQLLRALGPTNFSHLWEDNPVLDLADKRRESAENCIALVCIAVLGGSYEAIDELLEVQDSLPIAVEDRAKTSDLRRACERLIKRGVLTGRKSNDGFEVALQIFREWLGENAVSKMLPIWTEHLASARSTSDRLPDTAFSEVGSDFVGFPVSEDNMLAIAQRLVYCGRQKDVAEIRSWLRQFDDDSRIEMAFSLLQRVAEKGFVNEGMRALGLQKLEEMILAKRQRIGGKLWNIVRARRDNLCIGYVDSDHKSGGSTARDLQKMLRPGKCSAATDLDGWMRAHLDGDALVVIVDDFAGTGQTLTKGVGKFKDRISPEVWRAYAAEQRIALFVMFSFPEGLDAVRASFPELDVVGATIFGDELRACEETSEIFGDEAERRFARDVLYQIGRELTPSAPLGHGDMGALVIFHNAAPNNSLPIFWSGGSVGERPWKPLFPRA